MAICRAAEKKNSITIMSATTNKELTSKDDDDNEEFLFPRIIVCENEDEECSGDTETAELSTKDHVDDQDNDDGDGKLVDHETTSRASATTANDDQSESDGPDVPLLAITKLRIRDDRRGDALASASPPRPAAPALVSPSNTILDNNTKPTVPTTNTAAAAATATSIEVEERDELSPLHVGRIIGKGGEMIRDLQARSGCRIDVRQDMGDAAAPRIIIYRGRSEEDVVLARELVRILCCDSDHSGEDCDDGKRRRRRRSLPLGHATKRSVRVPQESVGRIIGRDGETIRNLQGRSGARIQVDHDNCDDDAEEEEDRGIVVARGTTRRVTIIGTEEGVAAAMEMVLYLARNPGADGRLCGQEAGVAGGYCNGDDGIHARLSYPRDGWQQSPERQQSSSSWNAPPMMPLAAVALPLPAVVETSVVPCIKSDIGHIIGRGGITIDDIQRRSSCDVQIDRRHCRVQVTGSPEGIGIARGMLEEIHRRGADHSFAGGRGGRCDYRHVPGCRDHARRGQFHHRTIDGSSSRDEDERLFAYDTSVAATADASIAAMSAVDQQQQHYPYSLGEYPSTPTSRSQYYEGQHPYQRPHQSQPPPIVIVTPQSTCPSPWRTATTTEGRIYYYNHETLESAWELPQGTVVPFDAAPGYMFPFDREGRCSQD